MPGTKVVITGKLIDTVTHHPGYLFHGNETNRLAGTISYLSS